MSGVRISHNAIMTLVYGTCQCTQHWVKTSMYVDALLHFYVQLNDWITFHIQSIFCCVCSILVVWNMKHHWPSIDRHHCSASLHHWILKLYKQFMHSAVMSNSFIGGCCWQGSVFPPLLSQVPVSWRCYLASSSSSLLGYCPSLWSMQHFMDNLPRVLQHPISLHKE